MTIEYSLLKSLLEDLSMTNLETAIKLFKEAITEFKDSKTLTESNSILKALTSFQHEHVSQDLAHKIDLATEINSKYINSLEQYLDQLKSVYDDLNHLDTAKTEIIALGQKINLVESRLEIINSARDENLVKLKEVTFILSQLEFKIVEMSFEKNPSITELQIKLTDMQLQSSDLLANQSSLLEMHAENSLELRNLEDSLKTARHLLAKNEQTLIDQKTSILQTLEELVLDSEKVQTEFSELNCAVSVANEALLSFTPGSAVPTSSGLPYTGWLWNMFTSAPAKQEQEIVGSAPAKQEQEIVGLESPTSLLDDTESMPPELIPAHTPTAETPFTFTALPEASSSDVLIAGYNYGMR